MAEKKKSEARRITLKYEGTCKSCGTVLKPGAKATWYPGGTVYGVDCHKSPFANSKPKSKSKSKSKESVPEQTEVAKAISNLIAQSAQTNPNAHAKFLKLLGIK